MNVMTSLRQAKASLEQGRYRELKRRLGGSENYGIDTPLPLATVMQIVGIQDLFNIIDGHTQILGRLQLYLSSKLLDRAMQNFKSPDRDSCRIMTTIVTGIAVALKERSSLTLEAARKLSFDASQGVISPMQKVATLAAQLGQIGVGVIWNRLWAIPEIHWRDEKENIYYATLWTLTYYQQRQQAA